MMSRTRHFSQNALVRLSSVVASFLLLGFLLAACGSSTTTGSGSPSGPTPTRPTQTVNCGKIQSRLNGIAPTDKTAAQQAANCFYSAYQKCQPATLVFSSFGVDAGAIHNLSVKTANGYCTVNDGVQHYVAPHPPTGATTYNCTSMSMQSDGLHIESCGKVGTIVIPLA